MDYKEIIALGLLELNKTKSLSKITVKEIINHCCISKQTFYNHFLDKFDLIIFIYEHYIISDFSNPKSELNFYHSMVHVYENIEKYGKFMKEAILMEGQNNLKDYIYQHCEQYDLAYHQHLYGKQMPEQLVFATKYHANASSSMTISWILQDFSVSPQQMAKLVCLLRGSGMDVFFGSERNPYQVEKN